MPLNPSAYVLTPDEQVEKLEARRRFEADNQHLALPFPVDGLDIPPQYPGETSIVLARSFEGKSTFLKSWAVKSEEQVTAAKRRAMTVYISHEDTAEVTAEQQISRTGGNVTAYKSSQFLYIGRSFGMSHEDIAEMHMSNLARMLQYAQNEKFAEQMPFSSIFYDYIQKTPSDPERKKIIDSEGRRFQIRDDTIRLCNAAVTFACPIVAASQATLKSGYTVYTPEMPIPGPGDTDEAKEIYQIPDRVFAFWQVGQKYPPGTEVKSGKWLFQTQKNLVFMWVIKFRYHQPEKGRPRYAPIGRVFPLFIDEKGNYYYDKDYHNHIYQGGRS